MSTLYIHISVCFRLVNVMHNIITYIKNKSNVKYGLIYIFLFKRFSSKNRMYCILYLYINQIYVKLNCKIKITTLFPVDI